MLRCLGKTDEESKPYLLGYGAGLRKLLARGITQVIMDYLASSSSFRDAEAIHCGLSQPNSLPEEELMLRKHRFQH